MMLNVTCALTSAFLFGSLLGGVGFCHHCDRVRQRKARASIGAASILEATSISLECQGFSAWIIERAAIRSLGVGSSRNNASPSRLVGFRDFEEVVSKAGLEGVITVSGARYVQKELAMLLGLTGIVAGAFFSPVLLVAGGCIGAIGGWTALRRALVEEMHLRSFVAEQQLSHFVEVVNLGLKSGMSFDRSLELYNQCFAGSLSRSLALAQGQWTHGLIGCSEALRSVARTYDSPLFDRLAESIIRSLRFGTSLTENLGTIACEARAIRKAKLEEKVAKAPVKMLLPVGTLILPAMLLLILGPIMLDLMEGF